MTKFQMSLFDPIKIETTRKIAREVLQGKIPVAALEEMFPFDVKLKPPKPEAPKQEASPPPDAGVGRWGEKPVPKAAAAPPEDFPEEENKSAGEVPEYLLEEEGKKPACENGETHWKELLENAVSLHRDSINSIREAVRECHEILGKILELAPDSLADAYYGSAAAEACGCGKKKVTVENVPEIDRDEKEEKEEIVQKDIEPQQAAVAEGSMNKGSGEPPVCAAPDEVQSAFVGIPFSIDLVASDPAGLITGIEVATLPLWAALNIITVLPSPDAVARISGTPGSEDKGLHVMQIAATNNDGDQSVIPIKIKVDDYGFTDDHPGVS